MTSRDQGGRESQRSVLFRVADGDPALMGGGGFIVCCVFSCGRVGFERSVMHE